MARNAGAFVIGTCSSEAKAELASAAGADAVILYTEQDFKTEVQRITAGEGVTVAYDSVGKATFEDSLDCAVCVHGEAADLAAAQYGQRGLAATDLLPFVRRLVNPP